MIIVVIYNIQYMQFFLFIVDCGFEVYKKCLEKVLNDCLSDIKFVKNLFGVDLTIVVKARNISIFVVVEKCIKEIEYRGQCLFMNLLNINKRICIFSMVIKLLIKFGIFGQCLVIYGSYYF